MIIPIWFSPYDGDIFITEKNLRPLRKSKKRPNSWSRPPWIWSLLATFGKHTFFFNQIRCFKKNIQKNMSHECYRMQVAIDCIKPMIVWNGYSSSRRVHLSRVLGIFLSLLTEPGETLGIWRLVTLCPRSHASFFAGGGRIHHVKITHVQKLEELVKSRGPTSTHPSHAPLWQQKNSC